MAKPAPARSPGRTAAMLAAVVLAVTGAGGAAAYVNAKGGGTSYVTAPAAVDGVVIGGSATAALLPDAPTPLNMYLLNSNPFPVRINEVTATVSRVESALHLCVPSDFALDVPSGPPFDIDARNEFGDGRTSWPGTIELRMAAHDQTDCLTATVHLRYQAR